ncbi:MAG: tetratricopeptide repeat protein, partial [Spirochaetales bacterium]|nr:tetratricopeptide repeat protein [Spirochaetales bacterium]
GNFSVSMTILILMIIIITLAIVLLIAWLAISLRKKQQIMLSKQSGASISSVGKAKDTPKDDYYIEIARLKKLLNRNPDAIEAREHLGDCHFEVNAFQAAASEYLTLLDRQSDALSSDDKERIMSKLGNAYMKQEKYKEAYKYFRMVRQANPDNVDAYISIAVIAIKTGSADKGLYALKKVKKTLPTNTTAAKYIGIAHYMLSDYAAAVACFEFYGRMEPLDPESLLSYGVSLYMTHSKQALSILRQVGNDQTYGGEANYWIAKVYLEEKSYQQSNQYFRNAIDNKSVKQAIRLDAYYRMAENYLAMQNTSNAIRCWQAIIAIQPEYKDVSQKIEV